MDKDKLNDAAREYAAFETEDYGDIDERTTAYNNCIYGFRRGAEWLMQQPISERLTESEKEQLRWYYNHKYWDRSIVSNPELMTKSNKGRLVGIFGSDLFK